MHKHYFCKFGASLIGYSLNYDVTKNYFYSKSGHFLGPQTLKSPYLGQYLTSDDVLCIFRKLRSRWKR